MSANELDHLAIATPDWETQIPYIMEKFGATFRMGGRLPVFATAQFAVAKDMRFELMEPQGEKGFIHKFLIENYDKPTPHHITFKVSDIEKALKTVSANGFEPILVNIENEVWREFFIHPKETGLGFLVQCVETPQGEIVQEANSPYTVNNSWGNPTKKPIHVDGIFAEVIDFEMPTQLLVEALGGKLTHSAESLRVFQWEEGAPLVLLENNSLQSPAGVVGLSVSKSGISDEKLFESISSLGTAKKSEELGLKIIWS